MDCCLTKLKNCFYSTSYWFSSRLQWQSLRPQYGVHSIVKRLSPIGLGFLFNLPWIFLSVISTYWIYHRSAKKHPEEITFWSPSDVWGPPSHFFESIFLGFILLFFFFLFIPLVLFVSKRCNILYFFFNCTKFLSQTPFCQEAEMLSQSIQHLHQFL